MNQELLNEFLLESFENLSTVTEEITGLEKKSRDAEILNSIFRKVHTLKGAAGFLGFKKLQAIAHAAESLLDLMRENVIAASGPVCDCLLESVDACTEILKNIESIKVEPKKEYGPVIDKIQGLISNSGRMAEEKILLTGLKVPKELFESEIQSKTIQEKIPEKVTVPVQQISVQAPEVPVESKKEMETVSTVADSVVRVNVQLLDKIMNVVGELVLSRNQILQYANGQESSELNRLVQQLNTITSELQTDIMSTRMQPVGSVLSKFERIVRDLAKGQGKRIKLDIIGKETELDKTLLEAIRDPLTHLIRNSVDHGIETPETRKQRGKAEEGKITIRSFHESGQVSIEISDDGNGIDPQKVINKAIQKGILTADQVKTMSPKQILQIIFMPGFSTAEKVTNISGRGVGMDVVKSNVEKIGGSVDIHSEVGKGSTFKLKIPLTLAIVPALVVQDREETFAIPQVSLVELVRLESGPENAGGGSSKIEKLYGSEFFRLRGDLIPVFRLSQTLGLSGNKSKSDIAIDDHVNIVVLNAEGKIYGLIVDIILDTEEIVVKPLSKELKNLSFYAGATIMGDGQVALILDAIGFYHFADKGHGHKIEKMNANLEEEKMNKVDNQEFLICELGDHRHYAIPLLLVNRLEEFKRVQVEWSGDQALIKYGDYPMPLINLEESLHLKGQSLLAEAKNADEIVPCVVIRVRDHLYGLIVKDIIDIQQTDSMIHSDSVDRKGLLGTVFMKGHTITILDVHAILEDQNAGKLIYQNKKKKNNGKILMIEDSPLYQKIQKDFLEEEGFLVLIANNGREAISILENENDIKLIVTDIEMPVMNGWDFTEEIRKSEGRYKRIPIIAVSSKVSSIDKDRGVKCGFNEHLEKLNKYDLQKAILNYI